MPDPTFDLSKRLDEVVATIQHHTGDRPRFGSANDRTVIWNAELAYRVADNAFSKWLVDETVNANSAVGALNLFSTERKDLQSCVGHPDNAQEVAALRRLLIESRAATASEDRGAFLQRVVECLLKLETAAKSNPVEKLEIDNGVAYKWTVVTAMLSFANPRFPFVRPTTLNPEGAGVPELLFGDIPWQTKPTARQYEKYCERFDQLDELMKDRPEVFGVNPLDAQGVSAWCVAANWLMKEPAATKKLARLVLQGATILQGPPGTGKTWHAERLAWNLAEKQEDVRPLELFEDDRSSKPRVVTHFVQFHASFDYEDFVRGFRPVLQGEKVGFELHDGPFARMVSNAIRHPKIKFLLIVDEINRADLARVLGECIYLLDRRTPEGKVNDTLQGKRSGAVALRYTPPRPALAPSDYDPRNGRLFARLCVPENFLLLGTMNTADRSIAVVDVALRRRFAFQGVLPDSDVIADYYRAKDRSDLRKHSSRFIQWFKQLNGTDDSAGMIREARFHVGHSYFLKTTAEDLTRSIHHQLVPLLEEYAHDQRFTADPEEIAKVIADMKGFKA